MKTNKELEVNDETSGNVLDMEIVHSDEVDQNVDTNKEVLDEYEHSLWKWPTGRSKLTKVICR